MGPLDKYVVGDDALRVTGSGFALSIHHHWYRSLPLSSIAVLDLAIDGVPVDRADMTVQADGAAHAFDELAQQYDSWWFTTDAITITAARPGLDASAEHEVELTLGLLIPYILIGPPDDRRPLLASSHVVKALVPR